VRTPLRRISILTVCLVFLPDLTRGAILNGIDILKRDRCSSLQGKRVGLICNHTSVDLTGRHTADLIQGTSGVTLGALFSPEHGFSGHIEHGIKTADQIDPLRRIPIYSLYGNTRRPTADMLKDLDILIYDIQDVGVRFYTYITTLGYCMEEAARHHLEFYVLDRPNPLSGTIIEGETLDESFRDFTAYYPLPVRYGMTAGEIAVWYNKTRRLGLRLTVIRMEGWSRNNFWDETFPPFPAPSPNIPSPEAALLYAGMGALEATNISVGRGTSEPFQLIGAPWLNHLELAHRLKRLSLPGIQVEPTVFTPQKDIYAGLPCAGIVLCVTDPQSARPVDLFAHLFEIILQLHPHEFLPRWEEIPRVTGSRRFQEHIRSQTPIQRYLDSIHDEALSFEREREPFLLYP